MCFLRVKQLGDDAAVSQCNYIIIYQQSLSDPGSAI